MLEQIVTAIINEVGIENLVKIVTGHAGGPDKVKAILDAQYAAVDVAVDQLEAEKLGT